MPDFFSVWQRSNSKVTLYSFASILHHWPKSNDSKILEPKKWQGKG